MLNDLVYVYAIAPAMVQIDIHGLNDRPVRWINHANLAAAVSDVPSNEFAEEHDLKWLGPRAVSHQSVNARLHELSDSLIPLAFGTVFQHDARVREFLENNAQSLTERLARVRGMSEWVIALHSTETPSTTAVKHLEEEIQTTSPGRAHLLKKRLEQVRTEEASRVRAEMAEQMLHDLHSICSGVYEEPIPSDAIDRPLLRVSVLVPRADEGRFLELVDRLRGQPGREILVTGPWPAYRFSGLEHELASSA